MALASRLTVIYLLSVHDQDHAICNYFIFVGRCSHSTNIILRGMFYVLLYAYLVRWMDDVGDKQFAQSIWHNIWISYAFYGHADNHQYRAQLLPPLRYKLLLTLEAQSPIYEAV